MQAKEYWVIMCSELEDNLDDCLYSLYDNRTAMFRTKQEALHILAEQTARFPDVCYTLYHLVPTEHTTHKR